MLTAAFHASDLPPEDLNFSEYGIAHALLLVTETSASLVVQISQVVSLVGAQGADLRLPSVHFVQRRVSLHVILQLTSRLQKEFPFFEPVTIRLESKCFIFS